MDCFDFLFWFIYCNLILKCLYSRLLWIFVGDVLYF